MTTASAVPTWDAVLADLQARIDLATQCLDDGNDLDPALLQAWVPPSGLGPLPQRLLERAVAINKAQVAVEQRLTKAKSSISGELSKTQSAARKASPFQQKETPLYFDRAI
jgi:hypothetical protein